tara:strand:- start:2406 stop:3185 length:780 start_codon:yes stop_codon:yes gene_type:complete
MLVVISPAKKLDWSVRDITVTEPAMHDAATELVEYAKALTVEELRTLMGLSPALAELNRDRFAQFQVDPDENAVRPAVFAFAGDTYQGLEAASLEPEELEFAQSHLRILSGLYGLLRPLDKIQPYRLEMGSRLRTNAGKSLYDFWGARLAEALNVEAQATNSSLLINCASQEYFGAVDTKALEPTVVTPQFLEDKGDGTAPKIVSFYAKKARGAIARYIVQNRLKDIEALRDFDSGGYVWHEMKSTPERPVFIHPYGAT